MSCVRYPVVVQGQGCVAASEWNNNNTHSQTHKQVLSLTVSKVFTGCWISKLWWQSLWQYCSSLYFLLHMHVCNFTDVHSMFYFPSPHQNRDRSVKSATTSSSSLLHVQKFASETSGHNDWSVTASAGSADYKMCCFWVESEIKPWENRPLPFPWLLYVCFYLQINRQYLVLIVINLLHCFISVILRMLWSDLYLYIRLYYILLKAITGISHTSI